MSEPGLGDQTSPSPTIEKSPTVAVVIPTYNMAHYVGRAIRSCQAQSMPVDEIIVVDDCSIDDTRSIIAVHAATDQRIKYLRPEQNSGHLAALRLGANAAQSDWIALLDADDELTPNSIEDRINSAFDYQYTGPESWPLRSRNFTPGTSPELVYGDLDIQPFTRLKGDAWSYMCRELSLCQTSTIMINKGSVPFFPTSKGWNTDDEIVLAVAKRFPVVHCGSVVANFCIENNPDRMSNNAYKAFSGVRDIVREHRSDILTEHGYGRLLLWRLRILKAYLNYQIRIVSIKVDAATGTRKVVLRLSRKSLTWPYRALRRFLNLFFDNEFC